MNGILPKSNVGNKRKAQELIPIFQHAEARYLQALNSGKVYKTSVNDQFNQDISKFVINTMYKSWFVKSDLFDQIRVLTDHCSYCYFSNVDELDHYYDKSTHPEVAILPKNLVPACESCNQRKNDKATQFFQPYFEDISKFQWLACDLQFRQNGEPPIPYYCLQQPKEMPDDLYHRLVNQLNGTTFIEMAIKSGTNQLSGEWDSWIYAINNYNVRKTDFINIFGKKVENYTSTYGRDHWETVLYQSLVAQSDDLFKSIVKYIK